MILICTVPIACGSAQCRSPAATPTCSDGHIWVLTDYGSVIFLKVGAPAAGFSGASLLS